MGAGDESMAVKPYMGAIRKPANHNPINRAVPEEFYNIDFVYGYKCEEARQNLFYNTKRQPVYMTAALGIIFDPKTRSQIIFGGGEAKESMRKQADKSLKNHTDDIMCLTLNREKTLVASGQVGAEPLIFIWNAVDG